MSAGHQHPIPLDRGLRAGDPSTGRDRPQAGKNFTLTLSNQAEVRILLRSLDTDACLYVRSGTAKSGRPVNEHINDDDLGVGTDAHVVETLADGTHTIYDTTCEPGKSGNFTLGAVRATE